MPHRIALLAALLSLAGCGGSATTPDAKSGRIETPAQTLAPADLDRLFAIVEAHGGGALPEFRPDDGDDLLNYKGRAADLVSDLRGEQFRRLFDLERQGRRWSQDDDWGQALAQNEATGPEFAALVHSVSCAIMRVRVEARVDLSRLPENARNEVREIISTMDAIDEIPEPERTRHDGFIRGQSALRLARTVALLEFVQLVHQVPAENCALVRRYSAKLKPLIPQQGIDALLAELQSLGAPRPSDVSPAGYQVPAGE